MKKRNDENYSEITASNKRQYIISIDQSTQGTKGMLFNENCCIVDHKVINHRQIIKEEGYVEHDAMEIANNLKQIIKELIIDNGIDTDLIRGIGIANQRESVVVWDRKTGEPVYNSIVWQCNRATKICERFEEYSDLIQQITGLKLSPFFSGPKIVWILENISGVRERAERGELCCGTMDSWVIYNLTNGKVHKTDISNASRMMLMNIKKCSWDEEMCSLLGIPLSMLPSIEDSDSLFGYTDVDGFFSSPIPIHCAIGDSHSCLYAHGCFEKGMCMTGYGTGNCVMMNIGSEPVISKNGLLTSVAWKTDGCIRYAYDGVINYAGAVITWLKDDLHMISSPEETDGLAKNANPVDKTFLIPAFTGMGAPYWVNDASAVFYGMSRTTGRNEIVKAALDSIAYQVFDVVKAMSEDAQVEIDMMRVSGGPTKNDYLMQFQADILGCPIYIPDNEELTCLGVALIVGKAIGIYDKENIRNSIIYNKYTPKISSEDREIKIFRWKDTLRVTFNIKK